MSSNEHVTDEWLANNVAYYDHATIGSHGDMLWIALSELQQRRAVETNAPFGTCVACGEPITSFHNINGCPATKRHQETISVNSKGETGK